jgi:protein TonB
MVAFILSLAILVLFLLALLSMGLVGALPGRGDRHLTSITLPVEKQEVGSKSAPHKVVVAQSSAAPLHPAPLQKPDETLPPPPPPAAGPPGFIHMSHDEMAAADISKMPKGAPAGGGDGGNGMGSGGGSGAAGRGPGGATLYEARWYREPTDAELNPYLKGGMPDGAWAIIYCRTAPHYHVEDCEEAEESPRGTGLARQYRQAAWQFLVRPPTIDGKPQIGAWVSIRLTMTRRGSQ